MQYIALLRGVNVGGNNKISMPELKTAFETRGFAHVSTYINSGNVLFTSDCSDIQTLTDMCRTLIQDAFTMDIPVAVISAAAFADAVRNAPDWWNRDKESKHNAIFVIPPATTEDIYAQAGELKPELEQMAFYGRVLFWSAPIATFARTRLTKVVHTSASGSITVRNANTTLKLLALTNTEGTA